MLERLALSYLLSLIVVITPFGLFNDTLFLHSDLSSIFRFSAMIALILSPFVALAGEVIHRLMGARSHANFAVLIAALVAANFVLFLLDTTDLHFQVFDPLRDVGAGLIPLALWGVILAIFLCKLSRNTAADTVATRVSRLARIVSPLALAALMVQVALGRPSVSVSAAGASPMHVVMVVLDGWPAKYLHTFNPTVQERPLDRMFREALVFENMRTSAVWTDGFFSGFYWGTRRFLWSRFRIHHPLKHGIEAPGGNLLRSLQQLGVRTRWVSYHRAGIPETKTIGDYAGLRSVFLTENYAWLPELLGLDYNLVLRGDGLSGLVNTGRRGIPFRLLNREPPSADPLNDVLLSQVRSIRASGAPSFLLFHTHWSMGDVDQALAWSADDDGGSDPVERKIRSRDYRYTQEEEPYARSQRDRTRRAMTSTADALVHLVENLRRAGLLQDTMLILTADHGAMYERGRFWYGFHPEEEVTRVPLVVLTPGRSGRDERLFETIDLTQTLIEHFGGEPGLHPRAVSVLSAEDKPFVSSLTQPSFTNREWFLMLYRGNRRFSFNLHPDGDGESVEAMVDGFDVREMGRGPIIRERVRDALDELLDEIVFGTFAVHPNFRRGRLRVSRPVH